MRVAIVHEWLEPSGGSEKVLEQILALFPNADLFAVVDWMDDEARNQLGGVKPRTTFIQRLPFSRKHFRSYLPLMPLAIERLDSERLRSGHLQLPCRIEGSSDWT